MKLFFSVLACVFAFTTAASAAPAAFCSKDKAGRQWKTNVEENGNMLKIERWGFDDKDQPAHAAFTLVLLNTGYFTKAQLGADSVKALAGIVGTEEFSSGTVWIAGNPQDVSGQGEKIAMYTIDLNSGDKFMFWIMGDGGILIGNKNSCTP